MRKKILIVLLILFLIKPVLFSQEKDDRKGVYFHSCLVMPDVSEGLHFLPGIGLGYNFNSKWSIQLSGVFRKFKDREWGHFYSSIYSVFLDVQYKMSRKRLNPYIIVSEGIILLNSKWVRERLNGGTYESKDSDMFFGAGLGAGLNYSLNKSISLYFEARGYLLLYESSGIHAGRLFTMAAGISINL
jgi:opacity protein-like surface antigen